MLLARNSAVAYSAAATRYGAVPLSASGVAGGPRAQTPFTVLGVCEGMCCMLQSP
jgi:hypothetical protein